MEKKIKKWYRFGIVVSICVVLGGTLGLPRTLQAQEIKEKNDYNNIEVKQEKVYHTLQIANDPYLKYQWAFDNTGVFKYQELLPTGIRGNTIYSKEGIDIRLQNAWNYYKQNAVNRPIIVAIIDTGVDTKQEDLQGHLWVNELEKNNNKDDDDNGLVDDIHGWNFYANNKELCNYNGFNTQYNEYEDDHGTHCTGTIVATPNNRIGVAGIAGDANVKIMILKALGGNDGTDSGSGVTSSIVKAIYYAERMGAQICNVSFGGTEEDTVLRDVIKDSNMLFICASGNDGINNDVTPIYPASYDFPNVISVGNMNSDGTMAISSNYGVKTVDLVAPGSEIMGTLVDNSYGLMSGTSMAAPMVTGASALLYSFYNNMNAQDAKNIILSSVRQLPALTGKVKTGGMLDVEAMLKAKYTPAKKQKDTELIVSLDTEQDIEQNIEQDIKNNTPQTIKIQVNSRRDLVEVRIKKGSMSLASFKKKKRGVKLSLQKEQVYTPQKTGKYTVYIRDRAGVEVTKTILVPEIKKEQ